MNERNHWQNGPKKPNYRFVRATNVEELWFRKTAKTNVSSAPLENGTNFLRGKAAFLSDSTSGGKCQRCEKMDNSQKELLVESSENKKILVKAFLCDVGPRRAQNAGMLGDSYRRIP